jgi:hypothetical protein
MPLSIEGRRYLGVDLPAFCVHRRAQKMLLLLHRPVFRSARVSLWVLKVTFQHSKRLLSAFQEVAEKSMTFPDFPDFPDCLIAVLCVLEGAKASHTVVNYLIQCTYRIPKSSFLDKPVPEYLYSHGCSPKSKIEMPIHRPYYSSMAYGSHLGIREIFIFPKRPYFSVLDTRCRVQF